MHVALAATTRSYFLCACLALLPAAQVLAQDASDEDSIDTIVVTATRLGQTNTETGSSISVITAENLEALGVIYALDAVAQAPGVTINSNGAFGGNASVRIRGASSEQTLVLIDAVGYRGDRGRYLYNVKGSHRDARR